MRDVQAAQRSACACAAVRVDSRLRPREGPTRIVPPPGTIGPLATRSGRDVAIRGVPSIAVVPSAVGRGDPREGFVMSIRTRRRSPVRAHALVFAFAGVLAPIAGLQCSSNDENPPAVPDAGAVSCATDGGGSPSSGADATVMMNPTPEAGPME